MFEAICGRSEVLVKPLDKAVTVDIYCIADDKGRRPECQSCCYNFPIADRIIFPATQTPIQLGPAQSGNK